MYLQFGQLCLSKLYLTEIQIISFTILYPKIPIPKIMENIFIYFSYGKNLNPFISDRIQLPTNHQKCPRARSEIVSGRQGLKQAWTLARR